MIFTFITGAAGQEARYRWDIGGGIGMSGYEGDANQGFMFKKPGFAVAALARYNFNTRWSVRAQVQLMTLSGDTETAGIVLPDAACYSFSSTTFDAGASAEFNFFPYGIGEKYKHLRRWTPFASAGIGFLMSSVESHTFTAMSIPLGIGLKYKPSKRLNLALELTFAKTTGDHIDGPDLSDMFRIKSSFLKNTDWCSTLAVTLTYEFSERCTVCNRID